MKFAAFALVLIALARASPIEEPASESSEERSPRQFFYPQYYGQQYFYPRAPFRYPYFFQPSAAYLQSLPGAEDDQSYVSQRAGESVESRQVLNNLICSPTSALATSFICTNALPYAGSFIPTTAFQVCKSTNNLNKPTGTFQHLNNLGPSACSFYITLPDNTKKVSVTCSMVNLSDGTLTVYDTAAKAPLDPSPPTKDTPVATSSKHKVRIDYVSPTGADSFKCTWKSV